jgi:hypothetical protein
VFQKGLAFGPLLNLDYFCGLRVVAVVPRLHTLHDDPHQAGSNLEHPRGLFAKLPGSEVLRRFSGRSQNTECQQGEVVLLLPAFPNKCVELLQEKIHQRPFLTVRGNKRPQPSVPSR